MEQRFQPKQKRNQKTTMSPFSLKFSVVLSYYITIISNLLLILIVALSDLEYQFLSYCCHLLLSICAFISLRIINNYTANQLRRYKTIQRAFGVIIIVSIIFYIIILVKYAMNESTLSLVIVFSVCMTIWAVFHILFIILIQIYTKNLEQRPMQKETKNVVDQNLTEIMLQSGRSIFKA